MLKIVDIQVKYGEFNAIRDVSLEIKDKVHIIV